MEYKRPIENVLLFIEENLQNELPLALLAQTAGYSEYHFLRLFKEVTRLTPADYIRKRRLSEIARLIAEGTRPISEIAFLYGFNSKENFIRAFKAEHRVLPTQYKRAGNSLKLYGRYSLKAPSFQLVPRIVTLPGFMLTVYPSDESYTPRFWNKYNCQQLSKRLSGGKACPDYGVCRWNSEENKLDYFIGIRTEEALGNTLGTIPLFVSGGLYAVFSTPPASQEDFVSTIHQTWQYILNVWLPKSKYQCACGHGCQFETYIEASRTFSEDIYIPIEEK